MWTLRGIPDSNDVTRESTGSFTCRLPVCFLNTQAEKTGTPLRNQSLSWDPITPFLAGLQHLQDLHSHSQKTSVFHFCTTAQRPEKHKLNSPKTNWTKGMVSVGIKCHILTVWYENKSAASACCDLSITFLFKSFKFDLNDNIHFAQVFQYFLLFNVNEIICLPDIGFLGFRVFNFKHRETGITENNSFLYYSSMFNVKIFYEFWDVVFLRLKKEMRGQPISHRDVEAEAVERRLEVCT